MTDLHHSLRDRLLALDTAAVSDAMDSLGINRALFGISQRVSGAKIAGPAFTVEYEPIDSSAAGFHNAGNYIDEVPAGSVVVLAAADGIICTNWGDILTTVARARGLAGTVIDGLVRDLAFIRDSGYPLYSRGIFMVSAKNRARVRALNAPVTINDVIVRPGDWIFGDENGVLVVADEHLAEVVRRAENVNATEEQILEGVAQGLPLAEARRTFGYATPWERPAETRADPAPPAAEIMDFETYWKARLDFLDIHYHANPDTYQRRFSAMEAGAAYRALRGGVVLKSHLGETSSIAAVCRSAGLPVFGSANLNAIAGGMSPLAIQRALCVHDHDKTSGRLIVDLPTVVGTGHRSALTRAYANASAAAFSQQVAPAFEDDGRPTAALLDVIDFCQGQNVVLTTGHASKIEIHSLIELCAKRGGLRLLLNQPANPVSGFTRKDLLALGKNDFLFIEQTALTLLIGYQDEDDFLGTLSEVHQLIYSSDLGQTTQGTPEDWRKTSRDWFKAAALDAERIRAISCDTALRMLAP